MAVNVKHSGAYLESKKSTVKSGVHKPTKDMWVKVSGLYQKVSSTSLPVGEVFIKSPMYAASVYYETGWAIGQNGMDYPEILNPKTVFGREIYYLYTNAYTDYGIFWLTSNIIPFVKHAVTIEGINFIFSDASSPIIEITAGQAGIVSNAFQRGTIVKYALL